MTEPIVITAWQLLGAVAGVVTLLAGMIIAGVKWLAVSTLERVAALELQAQGAATKDMLTNMGDRLSAETDAVGEKLVLVRERVSVIEALGKKRTR